MSAPITTTKATATCFAVVRMTDGREWVDIGTVECLREMAQESANKMDQCIPHWAQANRQVRTVKVTITED